MAIMGVELVRSKPGAVNRLISSRRLLILTILNLFEDECSYISDCLLKLQYTVIEHSHVIVVVCSCCCEMCKDV